MLRPAGSSGRAAASGRSRRATPSVRPTLLVIPTSSRFRDRPRAAFVPDPLPACRRAGAVARRRGRGDRAPEEGDGGRLPQHRLRQGSRQARAGDREVRDRQVRHPAAGEAEARPRGGAERGGAQGPGARGDDGRPEDRRRHQARPELQDQGARGGLRRREEGGHDGSRGGAAPSGRFHAHGGHRAAGPRAGPHLCRVLGERDPEARAREVQGAGDDRVENPRFEAHRQGFRGDHAVRRLADGRLQLLRPGLQRSERPGRLGW